ncbi:ANTAR domain-containing protein [Streptomyces chumphonensis]|uniref:ANTAR domain-containing protein n=1 Tax=Streptomyces chumphonensis TaxID=1214925 RepID=UPI003D72A529
MSPRVPPPADFEAVFHASVSPLLVLDTELVIMDVNHAYATVTMREREELIGVPLFKAFPANPHDPEADGIPNFLESFRHVMDERRPHTMDVQKYDIPHQASPGGFREKFWSPVNSPLLDPDGELVGFLNSPEDVTSFHQELRRVSRAYVRTDTPTARTHTEVAQRAYAHHLARRAEDAAGRREVAELKAEIDQLRDALHSRATIDQAMGIVQAERRCAPEDAFQVLVTLSQRTNTKLRDVAAALVRSAETDPPGPLVPYSGNG